MAVNILYLVLTAWRISRIMESQSYHIKSYKSAPVRLETSVVGRV